MDDGTDGGERALYALLNVEGIRFRHHAHPPLHTVAESQALWGDLLGAHLKNLFLKDKGGGLWLVSCLEHRRIRIRDLERAIGAKGASFAKSEVLEAALGVLPGAVTPFALINDPERRVRLVLDRTVAEGSDEVHAHPLHNRATTAVAAADLLRFFEITGHAPILVDFDALEALAAERAEP